MSEPLVVVGASLAGLRAVEAARTAGFAGPIVLVGAEPHLPYDRPPLSKEFLEPDASVRWHAEEHHLRALGVETLLGEPAHTLDPDRRTVLVGDREITYGSLVIATGSAPRSLPGPASPEPPEVLLLRTVEDAVRLREHLHARRRIVVVGAGFIGSEVASAAKKYGASVTLVEAAPVPLVRAAGTELGAALAALHHRHGTDLRLGVGVAQLRAGEVELTDGTVLPADVVVVGIGSAPATAWLAGSGIELDPVDGGVVGDEFLAASVPGVYAAGDVAHFPNRLTGTRQRLENWTAAQEMGAHAGRNAVGEPTPYACVPYVWSDWYGHRIQFVGRPTEEFRVVLGEPDTDRFLAVYREDDRVVGALALNQPGKVMKYRRLIQQQAPWSTALALYTSAA